MIPHAPISQQTVAKAEVAVYARGPVKVEHVSEISTPILVDFDSMMESNIARVTGQSGISLDAMEDPARIPTAAGSSSQEVTIKLAPDKWSNRLEREFQLLADAEIMGDISLEESSRFAELQKLRRALKNPRSPEEVLFEMRRDMRLNKLMADLNDYVQFIRLGPTLSTVEVQPTGRQRRKS